MEYDSMHFSLCLPEQKKPSVVEAFLFKSDLLFNLANAEIP